MRSSLPTSAQVRTYWWRELVLLGKFDSRFDFYAGEYCFACGLSWDGRFHRPLERCHITAHCDGGRETVDNLHLLCHACHKDSEGFSGRAYWDWFVKRDAPDSLMTLAMLRPDGRVLAHRFIRGDHL